VGGCIFCSIVRGEAPSYRLYEDDKVIVILDKYPVSEGHSLVISRRHYVNITDAPMDLVAHAFRVAAALAKVFRWKLGARGVNVIANAGRAAFQEVMHLHIHVIPRWHSQGRLFGGRHTLTSEEAERVVSMLAPYRDIISRMVAGSADIVNESTEGSPLPG